MEMRLKITIEVPKPPNIRRTTILKIGVSCDKDPRDFKVENKLFCTV
jgi:hypothetical protein